MHKIGDLVLVSSLQSCGLYFHYLTTTAASRWPSNGLFTTFLFFSSPSVALSQRCDLAEVAKASMALEDPHGPPMATTIDNLIGLPPPFSLSLPRSLISASIWTKTIKQSNTGCSNSYCWPSKMESSYKSSKPCRVQSILIVGQYSMIIDMRSISIPSLDNISSNPISYQLVQAIHKW